MRIVYFAHSIRSCWNHGNAHFLRGVLRALTRAGHMVTAYEPADGWSHANMVAAGGDPYAWWAHYPGLDCRVMAPEDDLVRLVDRAALVIVHEWNDPALVAALGQLRRRMGFTLLFHDTHHRAVSDPEAIRRYDLAAYDGVLAFGEALAAVYRRWGWGDRVFVWHEAADIALFRPPAEDGLRQGAVWIGNWGDGERTAELEAFLMRPAQAAGIPLDIHGVRYPEAALALLTRHGAAYHGWLPNVAAPATFARHVFTVHVPRRHYAQTLPGIPTIRVFEALACGIPLLSAPWEDSENLFTPGTDYLVAADGAAMTQAMRDVAGDPALAQALAASGLAAIRARHTCQHRAQELLAIVAGLTAPQRRRA